MSRNAGKRSSDKGTGSQIRSVPVSQKLCRTKKKNQPLTSCLLAGRQAASDLQDVDGAAGSGQLTEQTDGFHLRISPGEKIAEIARKQDRQRMATGTVESSFHSSRQSRFEKISVQQKDRR